MLAPLFLGSRNLKDKIIEEIKLNKEFNHSFDPFINKLKKSENAFSFDLDSKKIDLRPFPREKQEYIENLTVRICNYLRNLDDFHETKNSIDQFYPSIYYLLSIIIDRFNIISQLKVTDREILVPNIKLLSRPFSTSQINFSDQKDIFNSYMLILCIMCLRDKWDIKQSLITYLPFYEEILFDKTLNTNYYFNKFLNLFHKNLYNGKSSPIYLVDNCISFYDHIRLRGRIRFVDVNHIWKIILENHKKESNKKKEHIFNNFFDLNQDIEFFISEALEKLMPFALIKAPRLVSEIVDKISDYPLLSQYRFLYDDVIKSIIGNRKNYNNFLIDHGGALFSSIYYAGQFKFSKSKCLTTSSVHRKDALLIKPIYIKPSNPIINFKSISYLLKVKIGFFLRKKNKKNIVLVVLKSILPYNQFIVSNPQEYKEQLENFEASMNLIKKLLQKEFTVLLKLPIYKNQLTKSLIEKNSELISKTVVLKNDITLFHSLKLAELVFITYPQTTYAISIYAKKKTILAYPKKFWPLNSLHDNYIKQLSSLGLVIDTSIENEVKVKTSNEYETLFSSKDAQSLINKIYDLTFQNNKLKKNNISDYVNKF